MKKDLRLFSSRSSSGIVACLALIALILPLLAACGGSSTPDANKPLLVWVDATRLDAVKLFQKKHPEVKLKIETVDRGTLPAKVLLFNRSGSGWPDVVFAEPELVGQVADKSHHYPGDLTPYVSQDIIDKFAPGSLDPCKFDGKLYCLRNDLAQNVLWYNKKLMDQFGYKVPTTWEEYQALGLKVAKEHPGYIIGAFGDDQALNEYYWSSQCPVKQLTGADTVHINLSDPNCTRMTNLLQPLIDAGALTKVGPFDPAFVKLAKDDKILMLPAASWYGEYVFKSKDSYNTPKGELSVALPPKWAGESEPHTGAQGGAAWAMSSHTSNPRAAADLIIYVTTNNDYQAKAPTFPAYLPAADEWSKTIAADAYYAENPYPILKQAAGMVDPKWSNVRFDTTGTFNTVVTAGVGKGEKLATLLPKYQDQISSLAQAAGYTVTH